MLPSKLPSRPSDFTNSFQGSPLTLSKWDAFLIGTQEAPKKVSISVYQTQQPTSPTPSDMAYANIYVLEKQPVSWEHLIQMFKEEKNKETREQFVSNHNREQKYFHHSKYTEFIEQYQQEFDFFEFLRRYCRLKCIPLPDFEKKPQKAEELP